jgi:DNA polymerase III alpha subunit
MNKLVLPPTPIQDSDKHRYIHIRSFLSANLEMLLDSLTQRRNDKKIDSDDLFGSGESTNNDSKIHYITNFPTLSKLSILLQEKDALGIYVSGNPLEEYRRLSTWARQVTYRDDIHVAVINKVRKIFTKKGLMMFALELTTPEGDYEGIIFPKKAMNFSNILHEKELYFIRGKLDQKEEKKSTNITEEGEMREFDELPKILVDNMSYLSQGLSVLLADDEATLSSLTFKRNTKSLNWEKIRFDPMMVFEDETSDLTAKLESDNPAISEETTPILLKLTRSLGVDKIKYIKSRLHQKQLPGLIQVIIEIESESGFKRAKGDFWLDQTTINEVI